VNPASQYRLLADQLNQHFPQALHFAYGVGGFLSPLIARPFLRSRCVLVVNYTTIIDEWPYANSTSGIDNSTHIFHTQEEMHRDTHVRWAYWIVALLHVSRTRSSTFGKTHKVLDKPRQLPEESSNVGFQPIGNYDNNR